MAAEDEKKIDFMLRASAAARRAQLGVDAPMPEPMRTQLHAELARAGRLAREEREFAWRWWLPRLALAAAVVAIASVGVLMRNDEQPGIVGAPARAPAPEGKAAIVKAGGGDASDALAEPNHAAPQQEPASSLAFSKTASPEALVDGPLLALSDVSRSPAPADESRRADMGLVEGAAIPAERDPSSAKAASPAAPAAASPTARSSRGTDAVDMALRFVAAASVEAREKLAGRRAAPPVMATFRMERTGNSVRIVDSDGSIYTGVVDSPEVAKALRPVAKAKERTRGAEPAGNGSKKAGKAETMEGKAGAAFTFKVEGTNQSLGKALTFEGSYQPPPEPRGRTRLARKLEESLASASADEGRARVKGKVELEEALPVEIDAVAQ